MDEQRRFSTDAVSARAAAAPTQPAKAKKPKKHRAKGVLVFLRKRWWLVLIIVVVIGVIGWLGHGYMDTRNKLSEASKTGSNLTEVQQLTTDIGKVILLPNEQPTLATVNDASKLSGQEFFKNAQNGDKVLIFSDAGRALLYRPSTKQVIEYSKVDLNTTSQNQ